jgi:hypothetical protein
MELPSQEASEVGRTRDAARRHGFFQASGVSVTSRWKAAVSQGQQGTGGEHDRTISLYLKEEVALRHGQLAGRIFGHQLAVHPYGETVRVDPYGRERVVEGHVGFG